MRVVFLEDVAGVAQGGDVKEVKNGFARNYLIPQRLAMPVTREALQRVERLKREADATRIKTLVDMKALGDLISSARLSFARPERLVTYLGIEPGAVTPFALINHRGRDNHGIRVILDAEMMQAPLVNYHPLVNTATTAVTPADLLRFITNCGHQPNIVDLAPATPTGDR